MLLGLLSGRLTRADLPAEGVGSCSTGDAGRQPVLLLALRQRVDNIGVGAAQVHHRRSGLAVWKASSASLREHEGTAQEKAGRHSIKRRVEREQLFVALHCRAVAISMSTLHGRLMVPAFDIN